MAHLQKERAVAEGVTTFNTLSASDAQRFINRVFVVRVLDKSTFYRSGRAKLVFGAGVQCSCFRFKKAGAKVAIAAHCEGVDTFDGGPLKYAIRSAVATGDANLRVNLPNGIVLSSLAEKRRPRCAKPGQAC